MRRNSVRYSANTWAPPIWRHSSKPRPPLRQPRPLPPSITPYRILSRMIAMHRSAAPERRAIKTAIARPDCRASSYPKARRRKTRACDSSARGSAAGRSVSARIPIKLMSLGFDFWGRSQIETHVPQVSLDLELIAGQQLIDRFVVSGMFNRNRGTRITIQHMTKQRFRIRSMIN